MGIREHVPHTETESGKSFLLRTSSNQNALPEARHLGVPWNGHQSPGGSHRVSRDPEPCILQRRKLMQLPEERGSSRVSAQLGNLAESLASVNFDFFSFMQL